MRRLKELESRLIEVNGVSTYRRTHTERILTVIRDVCFLAKKLKKNISFSLGGLDFTVYPHSRPRTICIEYFRGMDSKNPRWDWFTCLLCSWND